MAETQNATAVLMVRPVRFEVNGLTAPTNEFQQTESSAAQGEVQRLALAEFDGLVQRLSEAGVTVCVFEDTIDPHTPDSIFPNNWLSLHGGGEVVLYPMMAENRRGERRLEYVDALCSDHGFAMGELIDLSHHEQEGRFLEGTGSLVLDRVQRVAYACRSPRTHPDLVDEFAQRLGYTTCLFEAVGPSGQPIYHTNVLLAIGATTAVLCAEAIPDLAQRAEVTDSLERTGHKLLTISPEQMLHFAGNMLELCTPAGNRLWVMSRQAEASLTVKQRALLSRDADILAAPIETIESCSGGSVRCMLAEVHLPRPAAPGEAGSAELFSRARS